MVTRGGATSEEQVLALASRRQPGEEDGIERTQELAKTVTGVEL